MGGDGPAPGERRQPLRPGIEADGQPVAGDGEAGAQVVGPVGDRGRQDDPGRSGRERELDRLGRVDPAGDLERDGDPCRDRADRVQVGRRPGARALEIDELDESCAEGHEPLGDPVGPIGRRADAGSGARPEHDARTARLHVDRRDDLHGAGQLPAVSSRRWKLTGSDPFRSSVSWNALRLKASPSRRCSSARNPRRSVRPSR